MAVADPPLDETPETDTPATDVRPRASVSNRRRAIAVGVVLLATFGFLMWRGLGDATVYFKTADEAVAEKEELGTRRFRLEGIVLAGTVEDTGDGVRFTVEENGAEVDVVHAGDPPELFQPDIPVVLEGHWAGEHFASDRILVKHSEQYSEENPERVKDYKQDGNDDTQPAGEGSADRP